ncbi:MAG: prolipoprotein diacylglyceryl transferase [Candidatus Peregrinibacteria bacterium]
MIDPIAFHLGPLAVRWYGIAYGVGLVLSILILQKLNQKRPVFKNKDQIYDVIFWVFLLGVVVGGRLGYVIFYNLPYYLAHPLEIVAIWKGGMSFHGGLIGSLTVGYVYAKKHGIRLLDMADMVIIPGALALVFGRLANFVNLELVGRVIESARWQWLGVNFGDGVLRWPSQLFAAGKDLLIFAILLAIFHKNSRRGTLMASFLMLYGALRFIVEFFRQPDEQIGFIFSYFTLGQMFSLVVLIAGVFLFYKIRKVSNF